MPNPNDMPRTKTPAQQRLARDVAQIIVGRQERQRRARMRKAGITILTRAELAATVQDEVA